MSVDFGEIFGDEFVKKVDRILDKVSYVLEDIAKVATAALVVALFYFMIKNGVNRQKSANRDKIVEIHPSDLR